MAATNGCELRHVYLSGHALLLLGFTLYVVGFTTADWVETDSATEGLWWTCDQGNCFNHRGQITGWLNGARALLTLSLMCYLLAFLLGLLFHCLSYTGCCTINSVFAKWVLEMFAGVGSFFNFVGICIVGRNGENLGTLQSSFFLTATSLVLIVTGILMTGCTRQGVANSIQKVNTITPQIDNPPSSQGQGPSYLPPIPGTRNFLTAQAELFSAEPRDGYEHTGDQLSSHLEPGRSSGRGLPHVAPPGPNQHRPLARQATSVDSFPISQIQTPLPSAPMPEDHPPSYAEAVNSGFI